MIRRASQRGETNLGCILWAILLVAVVMVLYKAVPVKYATSEFYDFLEDQSRFRTGKQTTEQVKRRILDKAKELELPLSPKQLTVEIRNERIRIRCSYTVPLELPFYTYQWKFEHDIDRAIYYV